MRACGPYRFARRLWPPAACLLAAGGLAPAAHAAPGQGANLQFHGFVSQGLIHTTDNNFLGDTDGGVSADFTEIGANVSLRPLPRLGLAAQLISRRAGEGDDGSPRLDYALADYTFYIGADARLGVLGGQVKNPFGLYNATRDVAFTRPGILLPQSIYFDRTRNLGLSSVSLHLYGELSRPGGTLSFQAGPGLPDVNDVRTDYAFLGTDRPGEFEPEASFIGRLLYEKDAGRLRLGLTYASVNAEYQPGPRDPFANGHFEFSPVVLSGQYNGEAWSFTAEYAWRNAHLRDFGPRLPDTTARGASFYLQAARRFGERWEALVRYDDFTADKSDPEGENFRRRTGQPGHSRFARDWTAGLSYQPDASWLLRAEFHHVDGTGWLTFEDNPGATHRDWNMVLFQAAYRF